MLEAAPMRLSDLTGMVRDYLQTRFAKETYWVLADVSDHKYYPQKGYHYFDLVEKDEKSSHLVSKVSSVAWQDGAKSILAFERDTGQKFTTGIHVLVKVKVEFTALYGLKLVLLEVDTRFTLGELEKKKQETIRRLLAECPEFIRMEGDRIVTRNQGHPFRQVLQRIAVLASRQSAGYQDFIHSLEQNGYGYRFHVDTYHVAVQGENKAGEVFDRLIEIFRSGVRYDVVVLIRGGGSESDFLIFNDFNLNRAIAKFPIPIITGIGHLKDQSIADLMAHTETKTPTKAAEYIIAHNRGFEDRVLGLQKNLMLRAQQLVSNRQRALTLLQSSVVNHSRDSLLRLQQEMIQVHRVVTQHTMQFIHAGKNELVSLSGRIIAHPRIIVARRKHELEQLIHHIGTFNGQYLKNQHAALQHFVSLVKLASPEQTLRRGFALIRKNNAVIADPDQVAIGDDLEIVMSTAAFTATVTDKKQMNGNTDHI